MQLGQLQRRKFITLLGGLAAAWPLAVRAQQGGHVPRIGALIPYPESDTEAQAQMAAFRQALQSLGFVAGRAAQLDERWTGGDVGKVRTGAKELVGLRPDVILSRSTAATAALLQETHTIPIVFVIVSDPVGDGFAESMARPGRNATGFTNIEDSLGSKWLELLKEINPHISRIAVLFGRKTSPGGGAYYIRLIKSAAAVFAVTVIATPIEGAGEIESAISSFAQEPSGAIIVTPDLTTSFHREVIVRSTARYRLPAIYPFPYVVREGGLISYGTDATDIYRRSATYVYRILGGAKPSDLPVQAPTKFQLAINVKTARALGVTVPPTLLGLADEVIE
jgi:putative ABC transport system substrate-binding protein